MSRTADSKKCTYYLEPDQDHRLNRLKDDLRPFGLGHADHSVLVRAVMGLFEETRSGPSGSIVMSAYASRVRLELDLKRDRDRRINPGRTRRG